MSQFKAAITRYRGNDEALREAVALSGAFDSLGPSTKVFIKPNIVIWSDKVQYPKWGVITTSRVVEDAVALLYEKGVRDITLAEGMIAVDPKEKKGNARNAYESLGYHRLVERYGVKLMDVLEGPYGTVEAAGMTLRVFKPALEADVIVNLPVLKTHVQTVVSLGLKNIKGLLDVASRKKCHRADPEFNLNHVIARLYRALPPMVTIIDGIYSLERGPSPDGKPRPTNLIIASPDPLTADLAGARLLGYGPSSVPFLAEALAAAGRPADLSDIEFAGVPVEEAASPHQWDIKYNADNTLHQRMVDMGVQGLTYPKFDDTMCTYCSVINAAVVTSLMFTWKGEPWDNVEILTGKRMRPHGGCNKTILIGQCMYELNRNDPRIKELIAVKGCPPDVEEAGEALRKAGIPVDLNIFRNIEPGMGLFILKYKNKAEFDESFYRPLRETGD